MIDIVDKWAEAWSTRREADLKAIYDTEVVFRTAGMNQPFSGVKRLSQFTERLEKVVPKTSIEVVEVLEAVDGRSVAVRWKSKALNHLDTSRFVDQEGISRLKVENGKIVDEETVYDRLNLLADVLALKKSI